jgi:polysaccharide pyruvyl transferase WcaK-like protein
MKAICASLDLVITGRMHLSIAGLGEGTPVGCIVYQDKFEGLIEGHFQLQDVLIEPAEAFAPGGFHKFLARLLPRLPEVREKIQERLPHVRELAEENFRQPS